MTWGLRDYGTGTWEGGDEGCDHTPALRDGATSGLGATADKKRAIREGYYGATCGKCGARRVDNQIGLEETPDAYLARMVDVFREVRRVLAPHGTVWCNMGDGYAAQGGERQYGSSDNVIGRGDAPGPRISAPNLKPKDLIGMPWRLALALQAPYYTGKIKDERDRIWLAAIVEAEGCMFIHRRKAGQSNGQGYHRKNDNYGPGLEVSSTDRSIVQRCLDIAGVGSICEQTPEANHRRKQTIYRWNVRTLECRDVVRELYPHMVAKQHEARLLLGCPSSGEDARKAWQSLKNLHQGDQPCIDFQPPEGMWERGWFLRSEIIWAKCMPNPMPESVTDRPTKGHEQIFLLTKQARYFYDADAVREDVKPESLERYSAGYNASWKRAQEGSIDDPRRDGFKGTPDMLGKGRNLRTVWNIPTQPFSAEREYGYGTFYRASVDCPEHGLRAVPGRWRKAADGEPQDRHRHRIDSTDARLALELHAGCEANSCRIQTSPASDGARTSGSTPESRTQDPSLSVDSPDGGASSPDRTTSTRSSRERRADSSDSTDHGSSGSATPRSTGTHRTGRVPATSPACTPSAETPARTGGTSDRPGNGEPSDHTHASRTVEDFEPDVTGNGRGARTSCRTARTCTCTKHTMDHFATFPERLPELCILAGCPERVCSVCGKPSERIVESTGYTKHRPSAGNDPRSRSEDKQAEGSIKGHHGWKGNNLLKNPPMTVGFTDCGHNAWRPGIVLDPFAGSGTTLHVARKHGRHSIGIELNPDYCELAARRLAQQSIFSLGGEL